VHWLEKDKSGKLIWQQSQGGLETLRSFIDTESSHKYTPEDLDKLLEQAKLKRVMLISDTAGMGKSTVLTHLSKRIKQKFPGKWVLRIDLNDHTDALKALKVKQIDKQKVTEFVSEKMLKLKPGLEKELFKKCCEQEQKVRIVIMLDGFDEISPTYKQTVICLLQALRQTAVEQLWVTTRPHLREELEDELQQLSYTLEPFSNENQIEFLRKFWSLRDWFTGTDNEDKKRENNKLEVFAEHLIKKLANSISDKHREFTGIPLQTRMLAEAFDEEVRIFYQSGESVPELTFELNLLELYEKFIDRKYDIYQREKCKVSVNNVAAKEQREIDLEIMREDHQLLALKELFTEEQVTQLQNNSQCTFSVEKLTRFGIVQLSDNGTAHFIHRNFAQYYVADCLANRLTEWKHTSEQVLTFILKEVFIKYDYSVIRIFVDSLLSRSKISEEMLKQYGNWIHDLREYDYKMLHRAAFEGNANIIGFLLDSVQAGKHRDTVNKLLLTTDEEGLTAWHVAAIFNNAHVLQRIWECAEKVLTEEELKRELLLAGVKLKQKSLDRIAWWGTEDQLRLWTDKGLVQIRRSKNEAGTVWHVAAYLGNLKVLQKLWELAEENLTTHGRKEILLFDKDKMGRTVWHSAIIGGNLETLLQLLEWAKEKLTTEDINKLLGTDDGGSTNWHWEAARGRLETLQKVWESAKEILTKEEFSKLLLGTDRHGRTAWHWATYRDSSKTLQKAWEWAKENLSKEELNKLLLHTDKFRANVWHWAVYRNCSETLLKVWEWAKEILKKEELSKLLLGTDLYGRTAWHHAADRDSSETLLKVWECAKEILTKEELSKLLLVTDQYGTNAWHQAAYKGRSETLQNVWECAKEILTKEELNKLLLSTKKEGMTAWHQAAGRDSSETLQKVWECAKEILTKEELSKLLLGTDQYGRNAWHWATEFTYNSETLLKVWECAKEILTKEELSKLLLGTDQCGRTAWHQAAGRDSLETLQKVWECAKEILTKEELSKLLLGTDKYGRTVWQWAADRGSSETLQKVWECTKDILTKEELNKLLLSKTKTE
jgi:ankyrin repeat protein